MLYDISMSYESQKEYFERAYRTGSDIWTHTPYTLKGKDLLPYLPPNAMLLDLGSGRGRFPFELVKLGFKVIGLEYVKEIVEKNNEEVKVNKISDKIRFIEGDALDIQFADASFDGVMDFGLLQHIARSDWPTYIEECTRVVKPGGYILLALLSRETEKYLHWTPKKDDKGDFENEGVLYHFFTLDEITNLFGKNFTLEHYKIDYIEERGDLAYLVTLLRKK